MKNLHDANPLIKYVLVFNNYGAAAGGSIEHTHSQIVAMPIVPRNVHNEIENSRTYFKKNHHCIFCTLIDEALTFEATIYDRRTGKIKRRLDIGQYIVDRGTYFIAIKPFASRFEWEIHLLPLKHQHDFLNITAGEIKDLAYVVRRCMARLDAVLGGLQYNFFLHTMPRSSDSNELTDSFHWHLEICPRTSIPTGFELGSGLFINTISPELAAKRLREVSLKD